MNKAFYKDSSWQGPVLKRWYRRKGGQLIKGDAGGYKGLVDETLRVEGENLAADYY